MTIKQTDTREQYFKDLQNRHIIEHCPSESSESVWYLSHHCVWKEKLRVVFDGSFGTPSLNDMLLTGPNLLNVIPVCLTSYRLYAYPVTADIEKAFLQIGILESDRDYTRFILDGKDYRFCRVPFGLTCSPALLNSSLRLLYDSAEAQFPETVTRLRFSTYVDDVLASFPGQSSLVKFKTESIELFNLASMNLRGWTSTPSKVLGVTINVDSGILVLLLNDHSFLDSSRRNRVLQCFLIRPFGPVPFMDHPIEDFVAKKMESWFVLGC